ncbi:MAG: DUF2845 domain-containing protein [Gammaproteobacteria bacterium]|nr:DUF2845 domain-containing protein [Gammaproteobacteria bacterium]
MTRPPKTQFAVSLMAACALLLAAESAWALRCGSRIVKEGMYESEVIDLCGEPATARRLGYVLRPYIIKVSDGEFGSHGTKRVYGGYHQELEVTELLFNFGPHKLMRIIRFEGGRVVSIETAGYGYREKK